MSDSIETLHRQLYGEITPDYAGATPEPQLVLVKDEEPEAHVRQEAHSKAMDELRRIAQVADKTALAPASENDCDYEEFLSRYGITSDFA